jgi:DNA adenine methylase
MMGFGNNGAINDSEFAAGFRPKTGFRSNSNQSNTHPARDWTRYPKVLQAVVERLQGVVIENLPAVSVMAQHDSPETLHYCDPPYVHSVRSKGRKYRHEMSDDDHRELAEFLKGLRGYVVVSGYNCALYEEIFGSWVRVDRSFHADGARLRVESLWLSPRTCEACQLSLLHDLNSQQPLEVAAHA